MAVLAVVSGIGLVVNERMVLGEGGLPGRVAQAVQVRGLLRPFRDHVRLDDRHGGAVAADAGVAGYGRGRRVRSAGDLGITFQAVRGVRSHFNVGTTLDESVFMVMGGAAYLGWALTLGLGILVAGPWASAG
ncbi:hypothetical protein [Nonomuraea jiangxiensis]|uniref:hypothetical protein n=1 Tax=Nonomuraea jiangxiensis TaxID=633440 RepID=UPI00115FC4CA|nr:hypothetical protein [Nonomuraea jiangxiensis]